MRKKAKQALQILATLIALGVMVFVLKHCADQKENKKYDVADKTRYIKNKYGICQTFHPDKDEATGYIPCNMVPKGLLLERKKK